MPCLSSKCQVRSNLTSPFLTGLKKPSWSQSLKSLAQKTKIGATMWLPEDLEDSPFNLRSPGSYLARSYLIATVSMCNNK